LRRAFAGELDPASYGEIRQVNPVNTRVYTQLFVARGRKHGINAQKLAKLIRQQAGVSENFMRDIKIYDDFSYVSVPIAEAETIQKKFRKKRGRPLISMAKQFHGHSENRKPRKDRARPVASKHKKKGGRSMMSHDRQEKSRSAAG